NPGLSCCPPKGPVCATQQSLSPSNEPIWSKRGGSMLALGLNSGSSFDGIDAVLVEIALAPDGQLSRPRFIAGKTAQWPEKVARQVLAAFDNKLSIFELTRLNYVAGALYAEIARSLMREQSVKPGELDVIGYDGQTIYQEPIDPPRMRAFADN